MEPENVLQWYPHAACMWELLGQTTVIKYSQAETLEKWLFSVSEMLLRTLINDAVQVENGQFNIQALWKLASKSGRFHKKNFF